MPRKAATDRRAVIDAVMAIIEESGFGAVSARSVAARLNVSTQPIYREFADMNEVRVAAIERGFEIFEAYVFGEGAADDSAARYVLFAAEHGNLFEFLFGSRHYEYDGLDDLAHKLYTAEIIDRLSAITGLPRERTYRLHLCVWMALHGLASIASGNKLHVTEDEIKALVREMTGALSAYYKEK
ncbi:MAG: TetR/AcrR family transcriptional regulator [Roseburia sp.]|nr:TetR/AcrR family transcriptional regulator [Roseburia sp.]